MVTSSSMPFDRTTPPPCPACQSARHEKVAEFRVHDQFRDYAKDDARMQAELLRRSGLDFPGYALLECSDCGLRFSDPMRAPGGDWYSYVYDTLGMHAVGRWEFDFVLNSLTPQDRIGEIGCGTGIFLARAQDRRIAAQGLDFSPGSVAECTAGGLDARLVHVDFDELAITADRSAVVSFHVLEHLQEPARLFACASRWAAPDAALWIAVPSDRNMTRLRGQRDMLDEPPHHLTQWTGEALRRIGESQGWYMDRLIYEHMGMRQRLWWLCTHTPLYRSLAAPPAGRTGWRDRMLRYLLYPGIVVSQWDALRKLSGLSMLARYRRKRG